MGRSSDPTGAAQSEPRLVRALVELAQFGPTLSPFERCRKLGEAKAAYLDLYPQTGHGHASRFKKATRQPPSFCTYVAQQGGMSARAARHSVSIWEGLTPDSRARLQGASGGVKQAWLQALSGLSPKAQARALDQWEQGRAGDLKQAIAMAANAPAAKPQAVGLSHIPTLRLLAELRRRGVRIDGGGHD